MDYGYICFAYSKDEWIAKAIAWFTKSQWSHTFFTAPSILGREMVMEASSNGASMIPFDIAYRQNLSQAYEVYKLNCDPKKIDEAISKCMNELETLYGFLEYPWFIWRSINSFFGRDIKKNNNWSPQGIVCSGYTRHFLTYAGYGILFSDFGNNSANAQDIYNIVKKFPDLFELVEKKL